MRADGVITVSLAWDCKDLLLLFLFPPPSLYCHLHKKVNNPPTQHPQNTQNITQNRTMLHYLTKNGVWRSQKCYEGYCRGIAVRTDVYDADVSTDNHPRTFSHKQRMNIQKEWLSCSHPGGTTSAPGASCWSSAATAATEQHREVRTLRK